MRPIAAARAAIPASARPVTRHRRARGAAMGPETAPSGSSISCRTAADVPRSPVRRPANQTRAKLYSFAAACVASNTASSNAGVRAARRGPFLAGGPDGLTARAALPIVRRKRRGRRMANDPLLQPFQLRGLTLRNRLMSTAHEPAYTDDGMPKARYRLYHAEKARGGIALTMIGGSSVVAPDSPQAFGNILLYKDECVRWLKELADDVHDKGAAVMIQITHLGRRTSWSKDDWLPVIAPSHVREPAHRAFPKAMEDWDIARVIAAYADAAERAKAGGLDGVEFECYGHLIDQFWSPATNKRADDYGGSIENRLRFGMAVFAAVRQRVGPDFLMGARLVCDEDWERGLSREEGMAIALRLTRSGLIDFLNVIRGHIDSDEALSRVIPGMGERSAPHLDFAGEVRAEMRLPTFHAARIQDVATARHAIASGKLDMVGMTRAHLADPHIALKVAEGREAEIRPCVGMGYCIDSIYAGQAVCIHNAATGREETIPHVVSRSQGPKKKVVVVVAGAEDVLALDPDVVVVATGGAPNVEFLDFGDELATTSWDLLAGLARPH